MAIPWEYGFFFTLRQILGLSNVRDPMEIIGFIIMAIAGIIGILLLKVLYKNYKASGATETLLFFIAGICLFIGIIVRIINQFLYLYLGLVELGQMTGITPLIFIGAAVVCADIFAFRSTYPQHVKLLTTIIIILTLIYIGVVGWAIFYGAPYFRLSNDIKLNYVFDPTIMVIVYLTIMPCFVISPTIFIYYGIKVREENRPKSNVSLWIGIGLICLILGLINNIAPIFPYEFSIPLRAFNIGFVSILYVCFSLPDWFKQRIGWTD